MTTLKEITQRLEADGISYTIREPKPEEYWAALIVQIDGGCREAPLCIVIGQTMGEYTLFDLRFGRYDYELFEFNEDCVLDEVMRNIQAIQSGKTHVIAAWYTRTHRWCGDACYYVSPGEDDDDSDEYAAALRRIERKKNSFVRRLTRRVTYAIYNWNNYREITR